MRNEVQFKAVFKRAVSDMQTRRDVLGAVTCLAGLTLIASCDSEPKPASTAKEGAESVRGALDNLKKALGYTS